MLPAKIKKEVDEEAIRKEEEKRREEERLRKEEKEREAEIARKKEKERLEKEQERQRQEERKKLLLLSQERDRLKKLEEEREKEKREKLEKSEKEKPKDSEKEKKKSKKEKKDKDRDKSKKDKKKEKKEKKKMKEKERNKPDEPQLFTPITPVLKIKPMEAPSAESPATPKLVIKNIPKNPPAVKEEPAVSTLGFQPLRHGPARTPKPSAAKIEKKTKRPSGDQAAGPSSAKKPREKHPKVKSKEVIEADSDDNTPGIITETVGSYTDESGNKVWICPACGKQDDGSPMIGCDSCDDW